ncbi:MAG: LacI family DNA-binding transcriptional regulator [Chloroflexota bacterium]
MHDVARHAGVSIATVSRVLNGSLTVKAVHRERVQAAIQELAYRPNRLAQNLRRQQAHMIGVVISDIENPHFARMVRVVESAAYHLGYRVLLCNTDESVDKQQSYLEVLAAERVLGVVISASGPAAGGIDQLLDLNIPIVAFDRPILDPRADSVTVDNIVGGQRATRHLLAIGHTRIGLVSDPTIATGRDRILGFESEMQCAGLRSLSAAGHSRIEGGAQATEKLLQEPGQIDAIIAGNNLMAVGALRVIRERGLRIPEDVAFMTFDDSFWSEVVQPPLTTLAQPVEEMSRALVELLMDRLDSGRVEPIHRVFPFDLRVRESCGARSGPLLVDV